MCVLYWIHNNRPWKQFVNHRVQEVHKLTDKHVWRHCPGIMNPVDLPSRGMNASELTNSGMDLYFWGDVAKVIRFVNALKHQELESSILTGSELMEVKFQWIRSVQAIQFEPELKCLRHNKQYVQLTMINQFGLFIGEDMTE